MKTQKSLPHEELGGKDTNPNLDVEIKLNTKKKSETVAHQKRS